MGLDCVWWCRLVEEGVRFGVGMECGVCGLWLGMGVLGCGDVGGVGRFFGIVVSEVEVCVLCGFVGVGEVVGRVRYVGL